MVCVVYIVVCLIIFDYYMQKEDKEIIKLTAKEILLTFCDFTAEVFFLNNSFYHHITKKYLRNRQIDRSNYAQKIYYLRKKGYIRVFVKGKKKYLELTRKGKKKIKRLSIWEIEIKKPKKWDGKWRVVIFDIPKQYKVEREVFRQKLKDLNFIMVQKSVYIHPFQCSVEIKEISSRLDINAYVLILISDVLQNEKKIISKFFDQGMLEKKDLVKTRD